MLVAVGFTADQRLVAEVLLRPTPRVCCCCCQQYRLFRNLSSYFYGMIMGDWNPAFWWRRRRLFCVFTHLLSWSGDVQSRTGFVWGTERTFPIVGAFIPEPGITFLDTVRLKRDLNMNLFHLKLKYCVLENRVKNSIPLILASLIFPSALSLKSVSWVHDLKRAGSWFCCWYPSEQVFSSS